MDIFASLPQDDILDEIGSLDIMNMTPIEAMNALSSLKEKAARLRSGVQ